jgi:mycothiol synthase
VETGGGSQLADEWLRTRLFMRRPWLDDLPKQPVLPPDYVLRTFQPSDAPALAALLTSAFETPWDEERVRCALSEAPDVEAIYVVAQRGRLVATASARVLPDRYPGSGYLHWVGVDPEYRGRRLGALVSIRVLQHFRDAGLHDAVLETEDFRMAAVRTYLRLGFVPEYRDREEQRRWALLLPELLR